MPEGSNSPIGNWVDPDIVAYYKGSGDTPGFDPERERTFKEFFEEGWFDSRYDDLRPMWDPLLQDTDPYGRVMAKTALWNLVCLRKAQEMQFKQVK